MKKPLGSWTRLLLLMVVGVFSLSCAGSDDANNTQPTTDGDTELVVDGDEEPETDGDAEEETPLPQEIGCEVDAQSIDLADLIDFDPEAVAHDTAVFSILVQAGSMTTNEATLWTYVEDGQAKRLKVWREADEAGKVALVVDEDTVPVEGYIKVRVNGLAPKTEYRYAFFTGQADAPTGRSLIGRFRTAFPKGCLAPLTIGGTHGTNFNKKPFKALGITAGYDLDMFVHLGDYSYNDGAVLDRRAFRTNITKDDFRSIWKKSFDDDGFRQLLAATGQYIVRDDHEVCDNSCLEDEDFRPEIYETGIDAMIETTPIEAEGRKLWRSYLWGDTAEIFLLDCRSERVPDSRETEDSIYIGREQMNWLKTSLKQSKAHFKIVLNSVPITLFDHEIWLMAFDRWQGYPAQREEILRYIIDESIENVWWLTGDFHLGTVNRVQSSGEYASMWEIMMGPGGNSGNPIWPLVNGDFDIYDPEEVIPSSQFDFFYGNKATTIVTFDPIRDDVHVLFFDAETGEELYNKKISWTPYTEGQTR